MTRVLAYTSPALGHLYPLTPILQELDRRGHQVEVRTLASQVALMHDLGFDAAPIDPRIEERVHDDWRGRSSQGRLSLAVATFVARAAFDAADLRSAIAASRPDLVIVDINSWGALITAEQWGGPWAAFCPYPLPLTSPDVPPYGPGLPPPRGPLGRTRDTLLRPLVQGAVERAMLPPLNALRADHGLGPLGAFDDLVRGIPLLLYLTAEPFEYPRSDWPDTIVRVGPCAWEPPSEAPSWLGEVTDPLVLVTTSSEFQDDGRLVATAVRALADDPVQVVATLPSGQPPPVSLPANARVERFVPHSHLLDRAVCAVTHGGMGGTQKALARGVPVCAVPFGRDQFEVARRVVEARAGSRLPGRRLAPDRLRAKVHEAMDCREGAARVAEGFVRAGGAPAAVDALEQRLLAPA